MKYLVKPKSALTEGFCFGCIAQCQNQCGGQCVVRQY